MRRPTVLSHATADGAGLAGTVVTHLDALGVKAFIAERDNRIGENSHTQIKEAIRRCDVMVVVLTGAGADSRYVHQEIGVAHGLDKLVLPNRHC